MIWLTCLFDSFVALANRVTVILFGSKFVILQVIDLVFGDKVVFGGVIPFIVVVVAVIVADMIINKIDVLPGNDWKGMGSYGSIPGSLLAQERNSYDIII